MANETEVRADGVAGAITDNPLTSTATTVNSAGLADLPAIGTKQFAKLTLFARDANGRVTAREVVYVTAHTAAATSATIARGQEGTTGVSWASGSTWAHGATAGDFVVEGVNLVAASSTAQTIPDVTTATLSRITLTANCTLTFPTAGYGKSFTLVLAQDATGSRTVTWPTVKWPGGTAPTLTTTASKEDVFTFLCSDGTTWAGFTAGLNF